MKINFRTLDRRTFSLDVDDEVTVADVKTQVEDKLGKEDLFRLIYSGRLLKDDDPVRKYDIEEKRWVVVMITRGRTGDVSTAVREQESFEQETRHAALPEKVEKKKEEVGVGLSSQDEVLSREVGCEEEDEEIPDIDLSAYLGREARTEIIQTETEEQHGNEDEPESSDSPPHNPEEKTSPDAQPEVAETINDDELREVEEAEKMEALNQRLQHLRTTLSLPLLV